MKHSAKQRRHDEYEQQQEYLASRSLHGKENVNWLDAMHGTAQNIRSAADELNMLARAFYATGNISMGDRLDFMSRELSVDSQNINDLTGMKVHEQYCDSIVSTGQILSAIVGGIALGGNREMADELRPVFAPDHVPDKAGVADEA